MKDIQKIKEFFSKPLEEANGFKSGKEFINIKLKNYPKAVAKINQLIDMIGEDKFTMSMAEWVWDFFNNASFERPVNEAKEEDKVDTITMDIPLFLRMLEYSREDASQDMDLHDVTEKANALGKEKGILSMEDYEEIVGAAEEIDEARRQVHPVVMQSMTKNASKKLKQSKLSPAEYQEVKKLKDFKASDWKWNADEDLYTKLNEGKLTEEADQKQANNYAYQFMQYFDKIRRIVGGNFGDDTRKEFEKLVQNKFSEHKVTEATDYMKRRETDDYAVSKKDKPKKPYNPTYSGKTDYMKRREKELAEAILAKLKK